jgi:hypothetical protein
MKLYCVKITRSAYVLAENKKEVNIHMSNIERYEEPDTEIYETHSNDLGWDKECLVYHSKSSTDDIDLSEALQLVNGGK